MAHWWTKPPIIIAALGVLAVIITALLSGTTINQQTSGPGSPAIGSAGGNVTITQQQDSPLQGRVCNATVPIPATTGHAHTAGATFVATAPDIAAIIAAIATLAATLLSLSTCDVTRRDQDTANEAKVMIVVWLVVLSIFTVQAHAAVMETITQTTTGRCSPAVSHAEGNVTFNCPEGIPAEQFQRLAEELGVTKAALTSFFKILEQQRVPRKTSIANCVKLPPPTSDSKPNCSSSCPKTRRSWPCARKPAKR